MLKKAKTRQNAYWSMKRIIPDFPWTLLFKKNWQKSFTLRGFSWIIHHNSHCIGVQEDNYPVRSMVDSIYFKLREQYQRQNINAHFTKMNIKTVLYTCWHNIKLNNLITN